MGKGYANVAFIRDRKRLEDYSHFLQGCEMEWVMGRDNEPLFLVAVGHRKNRYVLLPGAIFEIP